MFSTTEVWKKHCCPFQNAFFLQCTQYNVETQEKLHVLMFNIVSGVGGLHLGPSVLLIYTLSNAPYQSKATHQSITQAAHPSVCLCICQSVGQLVNQSDLVFDFDFSDYFFEFGKNRAQETNEL